MHVTESGLFKMADCATNASMINHVSYHQLSPTVNLVVP